MVFPLVWYGIAWATPPIRCQADRGTLPECRLATDCWTSSLRSVWQRVIVSPPNAPAATAIIAWLHASYRAAKLLRARKNACADGRTSRCGRLAPVSQAMRRREAEFRHVANTRGIRSSGTLANSCRYAQTWQGVDADSRTRGSPSKRERPQPYVTAARDELGARELSIGLRSLALAMRKPATHRPRLLSLVPSMRLVSVGPHACSWRNARLAHYIESRPAWC
jgi:hypothetical protein